MLKMVSSDYNHVTIIIRLLRYREMPQQLRMHAILIENPNPLPGTHIKWFSMAYDSRSRGSETLSMSLWAPSCVFTSPSTSTHMEIKINLLKQKFRSGEMVQH